MSISRNTDNAINVNVVCSVEDSDGNQVSKTTNVRFSEIVKEEPNNDPTLNSPDVLNGAENNQVSGSISAIDQEDGDLTDEISCSTSSSRISVDDSNGQLSITRNTDNSININVECSVEDSDGNSVSETTQVLFDSIVTDNNPTLNTPNVLNGGENNQVLGSISASDVEDGDLTNQISCQGNTNLISVSANNGELLIERLIDSNIDVNVECRVEDSDGNLVTKTTTVLFDSIISDNDPTLNTPNVLNGGENQQVQGPISAQDAEDGDLTDEISCSASSNDITIDDSNGQLTVNRETEESVDTNVECSVEDSDGNEVSKTTNVLFDSIVTDNNPTLNTPNVLNGGENQQVQGPISASDVEDGDLTNQISCSTNSNEVDVLDVGGVLNVLRLSDNSVDVNVECSVEDSDGNEVSQTTRVLFNSIVTDNKPILNTPIVLNGGENDQVSGPISASDVEDGDLTDEISCQGNTNLVSVSASNGELLVERLIDGSIDVNVECRVQDSDGNVVSKDTRVLFSSIETDNNPILNTPNVLNGGENQQISGPISASDVEDGDLTNQISCTASSSSISISDDNGQLTVNRETEESVNTNVVCSVEDSDGNEVSKTTNVLFDSVVTDNDPTLNTPDVLNGGENQQVQGPISASDVEDGDLTDEISCTTNSNDITIDDSNGQLSVNRETEESVDTNVVCRVEDSDNNEVSKTTQVVFDSVVTDTNPTLNTPDVLNGGENQQVQGPISASDVEDGDLTDEISCTTNSNDITIDDSNGQLSVNRETEESVDTNVVCRVEDSDNNEVSKTTQVVFDSVVTDTNPTLNTPDVLNGGENQQVQGPISASDVEDGDLTDEISCTTNSNDITIDDSNGELSVQRTTNRPIDEIVVCEVSDSDSNTVSKNTQVLFDRINQAPQVTITPSVESGFENLDVEFTINASDPDGDTIVCEVFIEGVSEFTNDCSNFEETFPQGIYNVSVVVRDEFGLEGQDSTQIEVFEKNEQEVTLDVNPLQVFVGDQVTIDYSIVDDANFVNCVLSAENELLRAIGGGNCVGDFTTFKSFDEPGNYTITLETTDKNDNLVTRSQVVEVIELLSPEATLNVNPKTGFAPLNATITTTASHPQGLDLTCELLNNGNVISTQCGETFELNKLSGGEYDIEFNVVDERDNEITLEDSILVFREEDKLENQSIDITAQSGNNSNLDVSVFFENETLANRVTGFRPHIVCEDGVRNNYKNEKWINAKLSTRNQMPSVEFNFELFINDFQLQIEYGEVCELVVEFRDNYGFVDNRSVDVVFIEPQEELNGIPSIRGQGIDFRNHLTSLLQDSTFESGYNQFSVILINNEDEYKEVRYTITGQTIGIREGGSYSLGPNEEKRVPMNMFVPRDIEEGVYPVRISFDNNGVRESKYTYIRVGEESMLPTYTVEDNAVGYNNSN